MNEHNTWAQPQWTSWSWFEKRKQKKKIVQRAIRILFTSWAEMSCELWMKKSWNKKDVTKRTEKKRIENIPKQINKQKTKSADMHDIRANIFCIWCVFDAYYGQHILPFTRFLFCS